MGNLPGHRYGYYQIQTTLSVIKYLAFLPPSPEPVTLATADYKGEKLAFTTVPTGDWNIGRLQHHATTDKFTLQSTEKAAIQAVEKVWHPTRVDQSSLSEALPYNDLLYNLPMYSVRYPGQLGAAQMIAHQEWYPNDIFGVIQETQIYAQIEGHGIGPRFLAHITENQERVCGYLLESHPARHATINDLQACTEALARLHSLKIAYGDLSFYSFLALDDGQVLLHRFRGSYTTDDQSVLRKEMKSIEGILRDGPPLLGQHLSAELHAEIFAIG